MDKARFKKFSEWTGLLRNLFTIVASFVSVVTLYILIRQNENTYRPDLDFSPESSIISIKYNADPKNCRDIVIGAAGDSLEKNIRLVAVNLGMGAAKKLHIEWTFEASQLADTVTVAGIRIASQVRYEKELNRLLFENCMLQESLEDNADFCLPFNLEKSPTRFSIPLNYLNLWSNLLIRICDHPEIPNSKRPELVADFVQNHQSLRAKITFFDINQKRYTRLYSFVLVPGYIDIAQNEMVVSLIAKELTRGSKAQQKHNISLMHPDRTLSHATVTL